MGICCLWLLQACKKDFLNTRPDKALLVPVTLSDMQALLDNTFVLNITPGLTFIADGDTFATDAGYNGYNLDMERNSYIWAKDIYAGQPAGDWNVPYQQVFYANVVLEGLDKLAADTGMEKNVLKGTALFHRALAFYGLVQQFAAPYQAGATGADAGIPVRLSSDVSLKVPRGTLKETYDRIFADLAEARNLLPVSTAYKSRPTVLALQALLARIFLSVGEYARAGRYADTVLAAHPALIDYNTLSSTATRPFPRALPNGNDEVIFYTAEVAYSFTNTAAQTLVDSGLYASYAANDLRKVIFYRELTPGKLKFKGNYAGTLAMFSGTATDELLLIRAECRARAGDAAGAMADLNTLLVTRWAKGTFVPYTATDADGALAQVLIERRKELVGRTLRWSDLRRLNTDPRFRVTLSHVVGGHPYSLDPGNQRYTYPIPEEEVRLGGLSQNAR
jgi:hypothetical protein